jgi:hypothetical protein
MIDIEKYLLRCCQKHNATKTFGLFKIQRTKHFSPKSAINSNKKLRREKFKNKHNHFFVALLHHPKTQVSPPLAPPTFHHALIHYPS